jgi:hypothetical protein
LPDENGFGAAGKIPMGVTNEQPPCRIFATSREIGGFSASGAQRRAYRSVQ